MTKKKKGSKYKKEKQQKWFFLKIVEKNMDTAIQTACKNGNTALVRYISILRYFPFKIF